MLELRALSSVTRTCTYFGLQSDQIASGKRRRNTTSSHESSLAGGYLRLFLCIGSPEQSPDCPHGLSLLPYSSTMDLVMTALKIDFPERAPSLPQKPCMLGKCEA
ncbi:hypothetical protein MYU51_002437 [Penicillium brevicompactum]